MVANVVHWLCCETLYKNVRAMLLQEKADALMGDPAVRAVLGSDALVRLLELLMGEQVVAFDHKWFRLVCPGGQTPFHMDSVFFGRSRRAGPLDAAGLHTVWLPWNDLPPEAGGLLLLEGSHRLPGFHRRVHSPFPPSRFLPTVPVCLPPFSPFAPCVLTKYRFELFV